MTKTARGNANPLLEVDTIEGLLDEYLLYKDAMEQQERILRASQEPKVYIYPSEIGDCMRRVFYKKLGYPEPVSAQLLRILENGKSMHLRYQTWFQELGLLTKENTEVSFRNEDERISFRLDGILEVPGTDWRAILELKSANQNDFDEMVRTGKPLGKYLLQVGLYMACMPGMPAVVLVECKNKQRRKVFPIPYSEDLAKRALERARAVLSYVDARALPPREDIPQKTCYWCSFRDMCDDDSIG